MLCSSPFNIFYYFVTRLLASSSGESSF